MVQLDVASFTVHYNALLALQDIIIGILELCSYKYASLQTYYAARILQVSLMHPSEQVMGFKAKTVPLGRREERGAELSNMLLHYFITHSDAAQLRLNISPVNVLVSEMIFVCLPSLSVSNYYDSGKSKVIANLRKLQFYIGEGGRKKCVVDDANSIDIVLDVDYNSTQSLLATHVTVAVSSVSVCIEQDMIACMGAYNMRAASGPIDHKELVLPSWNPTYDNDTRTPCNESNISTCVHIL